MAPAPSRSAQPSAGSWNDQPMTMRLTRLAHPMAVRFRRLLGSDCNAGLAAVEFAFLAPLFALAIVCTADLGLGIYRKMQVQTAAQAGAAYAATRGFNATAIANAVTSATSAATIQAQPAPVQYCGCAAI